MNFMLAIRYMENSLEQEKDPEKRRQIRNVIKGMITKMEGFGHA